MITIYHNPRCGKSRDCVRHFETIFEDINIVQYLQAPLDHKAITTLLQKLNCSALELVRTKEPIWITNYSGKELSENEIIDAIVQHPILMERPIVVKGDKAVIARPLERIDDLF
ncbi:arsenate reductase (glutaredoxin) [Flavobacterium sp.]|uniref:arsenate reductase (glutaredoxin) n=1 Tax=Flavobacterium sp. TaxID=239 RepID=UPI00261237F5|nr:arsenate reductase (glutaredoxin) [Flavobacterium sp.]